LGGPAAAGPPSSAVINLACCGFLLTAAVVAGQAGALPQARLAATEYDFGEVRQGQTISHDFLLRNLGEGVLRIERAELSGSNLTLRAQPIGPGSEGRISLELKTAESVGKVEVQALVFLNDPLLPKAVLSLRGRVRPSMELRPFGAVFLAAFKDEPVERVLTLVNNEMKPLVIKQIHSEGSHFVAALKTVEPGKVYVVSVRVAPGVPVGKYEETLVIVMQSPLRVLRIPVHLFVKPDLYATPDAVDFGEISLEQIGQSVGITDLLTQTIVVTSRRDQFSIVSTLCDLPAVTVRQSPSGPGRTFRMDVSLNRDRLERGPLRGSIVVRTSNPELPELRIPVRGACDRSELPRAHNFLPRALPEITGSTSGLPRLQEVGTAAVAREVERPPKLWTP
jgi:hypothetical protein